MDTQCSRPSASIAEAMPFSSTPSGFDGGQRSRSRSEYSDHYGISLLGIAPHHRVLDMYGSGRQRMHLIADELDERGELVANILGALSLESMAFRHVPDNVIMTRLGDQRLSLEEVGSFDRVLLDIPALIGRQLSSRQSSERLVSLLLRAIALCRHGGRVVFMTHGHSIQNNEMVVDQVINDAHKGIAVRNIALPDIHCRPGSTACNGQQLDPRIAKTLYVDDNAGIEARFLAVFECGRV